MLQLNNAGLDDEQSSSTNLHISYRTEVYSSVQQDITRAFAVDIVYRRNNTDFYVFISTDVDDETGGSFTVTVNGQTMSDPLRRPLVIDEILVKQMTNFVMVVSSQDFRVEFDVQAGIYVRLDPSLEDKVRQLTFVHAVASYSSIKVKGTKSAAFRIFISSSNNMIANKFNDPQHFRHLLCGSALQQHVVLISNQPCQHYGLMHGHAFSKIDRPLGSIEQSSSNNATTKR